MLTILPIFIFLQTVFASLNLGPGRAGCRFRFFAFKICLQYN